MRQDSGNVQEIGVSLQCSVRKTVWRNLKPRQLKATGVSNFARLAAILPLPGQSHPHKRNHHVTDLLHRERLRFSCSDL